MIGINYVGKRYERLANQTFQYAAVKGIAKNRGFQYCIPPSNYKGGSGENSAYWIPYSVGSLWAYARLDERIRKNYTLKGLLFLRNEVDEVVAGLAQPNIVGFSNYIWNINYKFLMSIRIINNSMLHINC